MCLAQRRNAVVLETRTRNPLVLSQTLYQLTTALPVQNEPRHEISNNVVCATSKGSDQPAHMRSLIRAFASRLNILYSVKLLIEHHLEFLSIKGGCTGYSESTLVKMPHCWKSHAMAQIISRGYDYQDLSVNIKVFISHHSY